MTDINGEAPPEGLEPGETSLVPEAAQSEESEDNRSARQRTIDHLTDTAEDGPQSVAQIIAGTALDRGLIEVTLSRAVKAGLILRVSEGHYKLAPPPPPPPPPAPPPPPPPLPLRFKGRSADDWMAALEAWRANPETWNRDVLGPRPSEPDCALPFDVLIIAGKREEALLDERIAQREREEAAARADYALMNQLIEAVGGNVLGGTDEIGAIKAAVEVVGLETVLRALRGFAPRFGQVPPRAITSFRDRRLLEAIAFEAIVGKAAEKWLAAPVVRVANPDRKGGLPDAAAGLPPFEPGSAAFAIAKYYGDDRADPSRLRAMAAFAHEREIEQPQLSDEISFEAWDELLEGYLTGTIAWNVERLGAEPGNKSCRAPIVLQKRYGFLR